VFVGGVIPRRTTTFVRSRREGHLRPRHADHPASAKDVLEQQRRAMAKAITLLESTRADHRAQADELLTALLPHTGKALRLGISGVPGVGKSTFIEALGLYLIGQGHRVAVLTIDPSSTVSGGSILGDKTRMEHLSVHEKAYIRPSPSSGTLGGVAEKTREAMLVCEAAGYDVVIVETVGVGQSETAVAGMTDMFVLLQLPNAGDDLQAIKKGVMEMADLVVINKADIDKNAATRAEAQITSSLRLLGQHGNPENAHHNEALWHPKVVQISALAGAGRGQLLGRRHEFRSLQTANGRLATRREQQALAWMWERIDAGLKLAFRQHPQVRALLPQMQADVAAGRIAASTAARNLLLAHRTMSSASSYQINSKFNSNQNSPKDDHARHPGSTGEKARAARLGGGQKRIDAQHAKGKLTRASASSCCWTTARLKNGTCSSSTAAPTLAWRTTRSPATAWSPATA
jgi:LAO/AO transport system kinase